MVPICQRSIGVQVSLCKCPCNPSPSRKPRRKDFNKRMDSYSAGDKIRDKKGDHHHQSERGFLHCQTQGSTNSADRDLKSSNEEVSLSSDQDKFSEETRLLLGRESSSARMSGSLHFSPGESPSSPIPPSTKSFPEDNQQRSMTPDPLPPTKRDHSYSSFNFKRKLANFRSDSVFSDVMPTAASSMCQEPRTSSQEPRTSTSSAEACEKSASLSSLKPHESKWSALRKKLGKINSSATKKSLEQKQQPSNPTKSIHDRRSLLQRAKTLSILPVRSSKEKEDQPKKPQRERKPKPNVEEMFNVGGEMNMIPLELLIDVNDLK